MQCVSCSCLCLKHIKFNLPCSAILMRGMYYEVKSGRMWNPSQTHSLPPSHAFSEIVWMKTPCQNDTLPKSYPSGMAGKSLSVFSLLRKAFGITLPPVACGAAMACSSVLVATRHSLMYEPRNTLQRPIFTGREMEREAHTQSHVQTNGLTE